MDLIPASYETVNLVNSSTSPSTIHCANTELAWYFRKYLFQKALSVFEFDLPEGWVDWNTSQQIMAEAFAGRLG